MQQLGAHLLYGLRTKSLEPAFRPCTMFSSSVLALTWGRGEDSGAGARSAASRGVVPATGNSYYARLPSLQ